MFLLVFRIWRKNLYCLILTVFLDKLASPQMLLMFYLYVPNLHLHIYGASLGLFNLFALLVDQIKVFVLLFGSVISLTYGSNILHGCHYLFLLTSLQICSVFICRKMIAFFKVQKNKLYQAGTCVNSLGIN